MRSPPKSGTGGAATVNATPQHCGLAVNALVELRKLSDESGAECDSDVKIVLTQVRSGAPAYVATRIRALVSVVSGP